MNQNILFSRVSPDVRRPTKATDGSAGWDIFAHKVEIDVMRKNAVVYTGLRVAFPDTMVMCLFGRSGLSSKFGLVPANAVGVIDSDYRGEIMVKFRDLTPAAVDALLLMAENATLQQPDRVVQALFLPIIPVNMAEVMELPETVRGEGGFGSTG